MLEAAPSMLPPPAAPPSVPSMPPPATPPPNWNVTGPCGNICRDKTCHEWADFLKVGGTMHCHDFAALGCSCHGCCTLDPPAPPPPPPQPPPSPPPWPPPPSPPPIPKTWQPECALTCRGRTCKEWLAFGQVTCSDLGEGGTFGCPCHGCCIHDPPAPPSPAAPGEEAPGPPWEGPPLVMVMLLSAAAGALLITLLILLVRRCLRRARMASTSGWSASSSNWLWP